MPGILNFKLYVVNILSLEEGGYVFNEEFEMRHPIKQFWALQALSIKYGVFQQIYNYWKGKPPPPVNDTNPYNVFRPREKAHRLHTRRMQRRENNVQSFEKLRQNMKYDIQVSENPGGAVAAESGYKGEEAWNRARLQAPLGRAPDSRRRGRRVRRNLDQAKTILDALIKREEKKRELVESEVTLQRIQMKYKHETELLEDSLALPGLPSFRKGMHGEGQKACSYSWLHKLDPTEPAMLSQKPLLPDKLAAAGIVPPSVGIRSKKISGDGYTGRLRDRVLNDNVIAVDIERLADVKSLY
ncbi:UNVERIFIED_CONTAM: hypothetical protein Scaly_3086700 [Sesamum calycinum]|uniref:Uncharacterized protein n=1 Tax=Sesamum calycinum TaxID=2727403 RepID=A0AAW2JMR1_9LAMI